MAPGGLDRLKLYQLRSRTDTLIDWLEYRSSQLEMRSSQLGQKSSWLSQTNRVYLDIFGLTGGLANSSVHRASSDKRTNEHGLSLFGLGLDLIQGILRPELRGLKVANLCIGLGL